MPLSIKELATRHGVTMRALRLYETTELLKPVRVGRARHYSENDSLRLAEILKGKQLGFTLIEIYRMLQDGPTGPWLEVTPTEATE